LNDEPDQLINTEGLLTFEMKVLPDVGELTEQILSRILLLEEELLVALKKLVE